MLLMPATAVTFGVTNRFEVEQNIRARVGYLAHLLTVFRGDVRLVAAAYISGERRIAASGLRYSNAAVFDYVRKAVRLYKQNRLKRFSSLTPPESEIRGGNFPRSFSDGFRWLAGLELSLPAYCWQCAAKAGAEKSVALSAQTILPI